MMLALPQNSSPSIKAGFNEAGRRQVRNNMGKRLGGVHRKRWDRIGGQAAGEESYDARASNRSHRSPPQGNVLPRMGQNVTPSTLASIRSAKNRADLVFNDKVRSDLDRRPQRILSCCVRKKVYRSTDELQADLDAWIKEYNEARGRIRDVGVSAKLRCRPF
jgi:hypothetical protein